MHAIARVLPPAKPLFNVAWLTYAAGVCGMVLSFWYLAADHPLDVFAGGAGFVAGSILVAGGLISVALRRPYPGGAQDVLSLEAIPAEPDVSLDIERWLAHFRKNQENRPEPNWQAPITLSADVIRPLVRSLEQFQLGDGGGPAYLIAWDREGFLSQSDGARALVDLWFTEEREHARLLGGAVSRFGGQQISGHWSFTAFCLCRKWIGVRFELTVLLLTEIVSTVYYRLLRRHGSDVALRSMCRLILRDEIGHVAFHRDRLARAAQQGRATYGQAWALQFQMLGFAAATMLWVNHAPGLKAVGTTRAEFYREVRRELLYFIRRLRRETAAVPGAV